MRYAALLISVVLTVFGQTLMKIGGTNAGEGKTGIVSLMLSYMTSPYIIGGFGISAVAAFLYTYSLSKLDYSYASFITSFSYILILMVSIFFFRENISMGRWIGCGFILVGIFFVLKS